RPVRIDTTVQVRCPREEQQVAIVCVVIGVMVCDENVPDGTQTKSRMNHLTRDAVTTVYYIAYVANDNDLGRGSPVGLRRRTSRSTEKDQPRARTHVLGCRDRRRRTCADDCHAADCLRSRRNEVTARNHRTMCTRRRTRNPAMVSAIGMATSPGMESVR